MEIKSIGDGDQSVSACTFYFKKQQGCPLHSALSKLSMVLFNKPSALFTYHHQKVKVKGR